MAKQYPSQQQDQFIIRLPDGMRDRIRRAAEANSRSMNAEIVATLEQKYKPDITMETLYERAREIRQLEDRGEKLRQLEEINQILSNHPKWSGWKLQLATLDNEDGTEMQGVVVWQPQGLEDEEVRVVRDTEA